MAANPEENPQTRVHRSVGEPLESDPTTPYLIIEGGALPSAPALPIRSIRDLLTPLRAKMTCRTPIRLGIFREKRRARQAVCWFPSPLQGSRADRETSPLRGRGCDFVCLVGLGARAGRGGSGRLDRRGRVGTLGLAPLAVRRVSPLVCCRESQE